MVGWNFRPLTPRSAQRRSSSRAPSSYGSTEPNPMSTPGNLASRPASQSFPSQSRPLTVWSSQSSTTPRTSRSAYSSATSSMVLRGTFARKYASVASRCGPMALSSHSSIGRWTWRSMALGMWCGLGLALLRVVVEALAGLPAEVPGADHPLEQRGRRVDGVLELVVQDVRHVQHRVQPDQVGQGQRPHGVAQAQRHPGVDVLARGEPDRKSTRLNSSHSQISYAVFCLKK